VQDNPLKAEKRRKLHELRAKGINPFPYTFENPVQASELRKRYELLKPTEHASDVVRLAGRVLTVRDMGKTAFFNVQDQSGSLQVYVKPAELPQVDATSYGLLDLGDIVGIEGTMFRTKTGEVTLKALKFQILCKTLEPLPEKYHGLADVELRYRQRHLDLITNPDSRKVFETRAKIIREIRRFLDDRGFLEVETPVLQPIYGGAAAKPFVTHHNALDMRLYMKISPELYLKRLIVGGFEKVYDLNKNFRNEGIDRSHNPEFTMIEWYEAYTDYVYQMKQFEEMVSTVAERVTGSMKVRYGDHEIDFTPPWRRLTVHDAIKEYGEFDPEKLSDADLFKKLKERDPSIEHPSLRGEMIAKLFELTAEHHLIQPTFIIDHPVEISPLTKRHRSKAGLVERFEPFVAGMELGNAYSELNDPEEQRLRLEEQERQRDENDEAHPMDEDFLHAIEVGMPPTGGVGLGIERLVMILTNQPSIRDIILFPTMKPHQK